MWATDLVGPTRDGRQAGQPLGESPAHYTGAWGGRCPRHRKFVGDVPVGGRSLGRIIDAACYIITGVASLIIGSQMHGSWVLWPLGLGVAAYGGKIFLTEGSYWVSYLVYAVAALSVLWVLGLLV